MVAANTYGRQVVVPLTNKSGGGVIAGDVVIIDTSNNDAFTTTTSAAVTNIVGVAQETIANNATGRVLLQGYAALVLTSASVTRGNYGATHTVAKQAADAGSSRTVGTFCKFLTGGTTPDAMVFNPDLGSASGSMATDALWDAAGDLAQGTGANTGAKLSAGTAGQFLMSAGAATANLWASRELDYVQKTTNTSVTATAEASADTVITGSAVAYDGSTVVMVEFWCPSIDMSGGATTLFLWLYDGSSSIGALSDWVGATTARTPLHVFRRLTPSNASHTYSIRGTVNGSTGAVNAGAGGSGNFVPAFIRITRAV